MSAEVASEAVPPWLWMKTIARSGKAIDVRLFRTLAAMETYADASTGKSARPGIDNIVSDTGFSKRTIIRHLAEAVDLGLLHQHSKGRRRGNKGFASEYWLTLPAKLTDSQRVTEDDTLGAEDDNSQGVTKDDTLADSQGVRSDSQGVKTDTPRCHPGDTPPHQEHLSTYTCSSSARSAGDDGGRRAAGRATGDGASAQAGEGTARDDRFSAGSRPAGEAGPAAPPGGGAPAATASRAARGHADDEVMRLAQELEQASDGAIVPRMIVGKLRILCQAHGFAAVNQAMFWVSRYGREHLPGPSTRDFGRVFNSSLEGMVVAYVAARDERAAELGADAAGFDLYEHLIEQRERAGREAAAQHDEAEARKQERQEAAQRAGQECQEIRALMETLVPHVAVVLYHGRADGEHLVRQEFLSPTVTYTGKRVAIRDDDMAAWKRKASRLAKEFGDELPYAEEAHPGDSDLVLARKFYDEMVADHAWLAA